MNDDKPICGAKIRNSDETCQETDVYANGRCAKHGGLSTGPKTSKGKLIASQNGKPVASRETPEAMADEIETAADAEIEDTGNEFDRQQREAEQALADAEAHLSRLQSARIQLHRFIQSPPKTGLIDAIVDAAINDTLDAVLDSKEAIAEACLVVIKAAAVEADSRFGGRLEIPIDSKRSAEQKLRSIAADRKSAARRMVDAGASDDEIQTATGVPLETITERRERINRRAIVVDFARVQAEFGLTAAERDFRQRHQQRPPAYDETREALQLAMQAGDEEARDTFYKLKRLGAVG